MIKSIQLKKYLKSLTLLIMFFTGVVIAEPMVLKYDTELSEGTTIKLPLYGVVNVSIDWGDNSVPEIRTEPGTVVHTYNTEGQYVVSISGSLESFGKAIYAIENDNLREVVSFGNVGLRSLFYAFYNAKNLTTVPKSIPNTVTNLSNTCRGATIFNQDLSGWDVSNVTNMSNMFSWAVTFNQDLSNWDVSNVISMGSMFRAAVLFNQDLSSWNVSNVVGMTSMFTDAVLFNQDLSSWDVSNVLDMAAMFYNASDFDQDLSGWDVSNVRSMWAMFAFTETFNQDLSSWDVSNVTDMGDMFIGSDAFNQDLSNWDISNVNDMKGMFKGTNLSVQNYDALLMAWSTLNVTPGVDFSGGYS